MVSRLPAIISDETVAATLSPSAVLGVIARAFADPLIVPPRAVAASGTRTVLAMPAFRPDGLAIAKVVHAAQHGLASHVLAFDGRGTLIAVVEAHRLTAIRTAAVSVLAAQTLGAGDANTLAVLGAGRQARAHIEAYAAALPIEVVTIWARRAQAARELAIFAARHVPAVRIAETPAVAAEDAQVITCATPATAPLLTGNMIAQAHLDLVGGFRPDMREADDAIIARAAIVADTPAALSEAGDLVQPIASGVIEPGQVRFLGDVLGGRVSVPRGDITVFKSVGHASEDLVVMELLLATLGLLPPTPHSSPVAERACHA